MKKCIIKDRHKKMGESTGHCFHCHKKIGKTYKEKMVEQAAAVPLEIKQRFLDEMHKGKTIGEARKISGLGDNPEDTGMIGEIIMQNIGHFNFLRKEAV